MDWKLFAGTFLTIFFAELGDKTQIASIAASAQTRATLTVWLAACSALVLASTIGVLLGRSLSQYLNAKLLGTAAGILFLLMGAFTLYKVSRS